MADRYWVGGTGQWDDINHWSTASGSAGGASVPAFGGTDNVYFDANSASSSTDKIYMYNQASPASNFNMYAGIFNTTGFLGRFRTLGNNHAITFYDNVTIPDMAVFSEIVSNSRFYARGRAGVTVATYALGDNTSNPVSFPLTFQTAITFNINCNNFKWGYTNSTAGTINFSGNVTSTDIFVAGNACVFNFASGKIWTMIGQTSTGSLPTVNASDATIIWNGGTANTNMTLNSTSSIGTLNIVASTAFVQYIGALTTGATSYTPFSIGNLNITGSLAGAGVRFGNTGTWTISGTLAINSTSSTTKLAIDSANQTAAFTMNHTAAAGAVTFNYLNLNRITLNKSGAGASNTYTAFNPIIGTLVTGFLYEYTRYWVGGTGNWNDITHWSETSGGAGGSTVPNSSTTDIYLDANSGDTNAISTINVSYSFRNLTTNGYTGFLNFSANNIALVCYGNVTYGVNTKCNLITQGKYFFYGSTATLTTNGTSAHWMAVELEITSTVLTLGSHFYGQLNYNMGTLNTNGYNMTLTNYQGTVYGSLIMTTATCVLNISPTSIVTCGSIGNTAAANTGTVNAATGGTLVLVGATTINAYINIKNTSNISNLIINHIGTTGITSIGYYTTSHSGGFTIGKFSIAATHTSTGAIKFSTTGTWDISAFIARTGVIDSSTGTTAFAISSPASACIDCNTINLKNSNASGGATFYAGTNSTNSGGNTGWIFTTALDKFWVGGTGNWTDNARWSTNSGGAAGAYPPITSTETAIFDANSGTGNATLTVNTLMKSLLMKGINCLDGVTNPSSSTMTVSCGTYLLSVYDRVILSESGGYTGGSSTPNRIRFLGTAEEYLYSAGKSLHISMSVAGRILNLLSDLTMLSGSGFGAATMRSNGYNISVLINLYGAAAVFELGSRIVNENPVYSVMNINDPFQSGQFKITAIQGTSVVLTGTTDVSFALTSDSVLWDLVINRPTTGITNLGHLYNGTGVGTFTIAGSLIIPTPVSAETVKFYSGVWNINNISASGSAGNLISLNSYDNVSQFTIASSGQTIQCDYLNIKNSAATGTTKYYAGSHSVNSGNNTGWLFKDFTLETTNAMFIATCF